MWTALLNKVKTKDKLKKFGVVSRDEVMCVLCSKMEEDCQLLFIHCEVSLSIWQWWCDMWGVAWSCPSLLVDLFSLWKSLVKGDFVKKVWLSSFVIVWTLWKERNQRVFNKVSSSKEDLCRLILLRISWWIKGWYPEFPYSPDEVVGHPEVLKFDVLRTENKSKIGVEASWEAPGIGWLKWNVDASLNSEGVKAGVGGVLRDWKGSFCCVFSCPVDQMDINDAEVWAS